MEIGLSIQSIGQATAARAAGLIPIRGRLWWDWVKRVRGMKIAQVLRAWYGIMRLFPRGRRWERGVPYAPESYGAGICGGSAVGRRATA